MIKKFKDKISFLSYLTSDEQYGPINISFSLEAYQGMILTIEPADMSKVLSENIYEVLYDIIWYHFYDTIDLLGYSHDDIEDSEFTLQNNNGELEMTSSSFNGSHEYETDEIIAQIKSLMSDIIKTEYFLVLNISGLYEDISQINVASYYLGHYNDSGVDTDIPDDNENLKSKIIEAIFNWAKNYSEECSSGEYVFDEFSLDFSLGSYENTDTWCHFYEEGKGALVDLSVLEINPEEIEIEI